MASLTLIVVGCTLPYLGLGRRNLSTKDALDAGLDGPSFASKETDIFMPATSSDPPSVTMWHINQQEDSVRTFETKAGSEAMRPGLTLHIQTQEDDFSALCEDGHQGTTCNANQMAVTRLYTGEAGDIPPNHFIKDDAYYTYHCAYKRADTGECEWNLPSEDGDGERMECPCGKADGAGSIDVIAKAIIGEYASANKIDLGEINVEGSEVKAHARQLAFRAAYATGQFFIQPVQLAINMIPGTGAEKMPFMGMSAAKETRADGTQLPGSGSAWTTIFIGPPQRGSGDNMPTVMVVSKRILQAAKSPSCKTCTQPGFGDRVASRSHSPCACYAICLSIPIQGVDLEDYQRTMVTISNTESVLATDPLSDPNQCKGMR